MDSPITCTILPPFLNTVPCILLKIFIELNRTASYILLILLISKKNVVKVGYVNSADGQTATCI